MIRKGTLYTEIQRNRGDNRPARLRFVAEFTFKGKRHRFRSTRLDTTSQWLEDIVLRAQNCPESL